MMRNWFKDLIIITLLGTVSAKNVVVPSQVSQDLNLTQTHYTTPAVKPFQLDNYTNYECHDIHKIPRGDQCELIENYCGDYKIGLVNYVSLYYCHGGHILKIISYTLTLMVLFTTLGITASEFLCPNLDTISKFFKMSESLAGVTLLALGNGSPDVFSTLEAMKIGSANLAIGELCGAALFITGVVVGSMSIVRPFKVVRKPFIRDILFLIFALIITIVFLSDGKITIWEALIMLLLYVVYVLFVVSWDWVATNKRRIQLVDQKARNHYYNGSEGMTKFQLDDNQEVNDEDILGSSTTPGIEVLDQDVETLNNFEDWSTQSQNMIRPSLLGAIEFNSKMQDYYEGRKGAIRLNDDDEDANISLNTLTAGPKPTHQPSRLRTEPFENEANDFTIVDHPRSHTAPEDYDFETFYDNPEMLHLYGSNADYGDVHNVVKEKVKEMFGKTKLLDESSSFLFILFPTLKNFGSKFLFDKIFSIICLPLVAVLRLTVPVVNEEFDITGNGFTLLLLQCLFSPFITGFLIFYDDEFTWKFIAIPAIISVFLLLITYTTKLAVEQESELIYKIFKIVCALLGFAISISWISTIAAELISIIKFFSLLLNLSDAILGVTVFAIGNSLGDFISNFTIARMGFPMMALSACFGGPLLNILLGIGGSGLLVIPGNGPIEFKISKTIIVSGCALLINLVFLLIAVPLNKFEMNKLTGWFMIGLWTIATLICVLFEILS